MGETGISWTHVPSLHGGQYKGWTWNPTVGCTRVSPGCNLCYAFTLHDQRFKANRDAAQRAIVGSPVGEVAIKQARKRGVPLPMPPQYDRPFSRVQLLTDRLEEPLHWMRPRAVFVDSMSDLFHPDVPDEYIAEVWAVMSMAPTHIFMILTKRPDRMALLSRHAQFRLYVNAARLRRGVSVLPDSAREDGTYAWPLSNVWLGTSIENQETADERLPLLADTRAAIRFVSAEPLISRVNLGRHMWGPQATKEHRDTAPHPDWIIVGGESGDAKHRREMDPDWAREIRDHCYAANVPFFFKQSSGARPGMGTELDGETYHAFPRHPMVGSVDMPLAKRYGAG